MQLIAVDLAARYSAACLMDGLTGAVTAQWDSASTTEDRFVRHITAWFSPVRDLQIPDVLVIEDLPHGVPYRTIVKQVCRLQGRIYEQMRFSLAQDRIRFLQPQVWRRYAGLKNGDKHTRVIDVAAELGYTAPALTIKSKTLRTKVTTDYCAAFLIAFYARAVWQSDATFNHPSLTPYDLASAARKGI